MQLRIARRNRAGQRPRRVLLVGLPPLTLNALEPAFRKVAEVRSVPFPGASFDRAAEEFDADLVVVDVTYLDAARVRPLIARRFLRTRPAIVYLSGGGDAWLHDARTPHGRLLDDPSVSGLVALASGSTLTLVAER
jgi:hypothetical protein